MFSGPPPGRRRLRRPTHGGTVFTEVRAAGRTQKGRVRFQIHWQRLRDGQLKGLSLPQANLSAASGPGRRRAAGAAISSRPGCHSDRDRDRDGVAPQATSTVTRTSRYRDRDPGRRRNPPLRPSSLSAPGPGVGDSERLSVMGLGPGDAGRTDRDLSQWNYHTMRLMYRDQLCLTTLIMVATRKISCQAQPELVPIHESHGAIVPL
jgi:hypothetical protein